MKKFYIFLTSLLIGSLITVSAQDSYYLSGAFNNYNPNGDPMYQLVQDTDSDVDTSEGETPDVRNEYLVYYNIPAGQFSLNIQNGTKYLVPAEGVNTEVVFSTVLFDMKATLSYKEVEGPSTVYWTNTSWAGGDDIDFVVSINTDEKTITFQYNATVDDSVWFIRGAFNDYNPNGLAKWALYDQKYDLNGENASAYYMGLFEIPSDQLSFNFLDPRNQIFCPYDDQGYEGEEKTFSMANGSYSTNFGKAYPEYGEDEMYCSDPTWKGGNLQFIVDNNTGLVTVSYPQIFVYGEFNEYIPMQETEWELVEGASGIYSKTLEIPENQFNFYLRYGYQFLAPSQVTNVEFTHTVFSGSYDILIEKPSTYWTVENFEGGEVNVVVNLKNNTVIFQYGEEEISISALYDGEKLELTQDEENANKFRGFIEMVTDLTSMNFQLGENEYLVPSEGEDVEVEWENGKYSGSFIISQNPNSAWTFDNLTAENFQILIDYSSQTVTFQCDLPQEVVWYIRGEFNEYDPVYDGDKWVLTPSENEEENGVYYGTFNAAKDTMSFNFMNSEGAVFIPSLLETTEMMFEASEEGMVSYTGNLDMAYDEEEYNYYWTYDAWLGGDFTVTLDLNESTVTVVASEDSTSVKNLIKTGADDDVYNLQGIRVNSNKLVKGNVYIINGKKVMM